MSTRSTIRNLTPEIDDINLPFQGEGLAGKVGHGNKFERISSNFNFEWTKFEFPKNRNKFESPCSNFEQTAVSIKRAPDIIFPQFI